MTCLVINLVGGLVEFMTSAVSSAYGETQALVTEPRRSTELYGRDAIYGIGGVVGNTALQPEESISRDIGIRYAMASLPIEIDLGYF